MNISPIVEKTRFITAANSDKKIEVDSLPKNIRFEVDTLDRIVQARMDKMCEIEILELAIHAQKTKLAELINAISKDNSTDATAKGGEDNE